MANNSSFEDPSEKPQTNGIHQETALFAANIAICSFGLIGNSVLLFVLVRYPPLRKSSSFFLIVNCVVTDLLTGFPVGVIVNFVGPQDQAPYYFCAQIYPLFFYIPPIAGFFATSGVAVHRLLGVLTPHLFQTITRKNSLE